MVIIYKLSKGVSNSGSRAAIEFLKTSFTSSHHSDPSDTIFISILSISPQPHYPVIRHLSTNKLPDLSLK